MLNSWCPKHPNHFSAIIDMSYSFMRIDPQDVALEQPILNIDPLTPL